MPIYDYICDSCGPFEELRPMAECDTPCSCPDCGEPSPRALLTAPRLSCMAVGLRSAFAVNERSANAPQTVDQYKASRHGPGCGCCSSKGRARPVAKGKGGAKSFPAARPWMISH
ncbi:putative regulatory protein, FmdB family [Enhydrobacter aerosaccus]|uniref:Putative regulatory protein, FmdB family n=1 Tax=Enhydrobacter aerosaccus TaxID=225324 RepID=A0A1T4PTZ9_9HYPH|nr:zinc ribbon domain-containing protein [Enhydrobacter aerosaccus]SJZ95020.1 putative regulatory protein, FmdB family [Enhydrobacter aerosaccus]